MIFAASENWIEAVGAHPAEYHHIYPLGHLTVGDAQAALDAQYGAGAFHVAMHGSAMSVYNYEVKLASTLERWKDRTDESMLNCRGSFEPGSFLDRILAVELERRGLTLNTSETDHG